MTDQHPITPPPELFREWTQYKEGESVELFWKRITTQAARWGADQELEACVEHLKRIWSPSDTIDSLYTARRPKPPSLKEQALHILDTHGNLTHAEADTIRRALEALKEQVFHILDAFGNLTRAEADNIRRALEALND